MKTIAITQKIKGTIKYIFFDLSIANFKFSIEAITPLNS